MGSNPNPNVVGNFSNLFVDCGTKSFGVIGETVLGTWGIPGVMKDVFGGAKSAETEVGSSVSFKRNSFSSSDRSMFPKTKSLSKSVRNSVDFMVGVMLNCVVCRTVLFLPVRSVMVELPESILGTDIVDERYGSFGNLSGNDKILSRNPIFFFGLTSGIFNRRLG